MDKWATPTGLMILVGVVVWLVQMENRTVTNAERVAALKAKEAMAAALSQEQTRVLARTTAIQDALFDQVQRLNDRIERVEVNMAVGNPHRNGE